MEGARASEGAVGAGSARAMRQQDAPPETNKRQGRRSTQRRQVRIKGGQGRNDRGARVGNPVRQSHERRGRARPGMHSEREATEGSPLPPSHPGTHHRGGKARGRRGWKGRARQGGSRRGGGARMEQRAAGQLGPGNRTSEVQAKSAEGRLRSGAAGGPRRAERRDPSAPPSVLGTAVPTDLQRARDPGPGSDRESPSEGPERTRGTARRRPFPARPVGKRGGGRGRGCREPGETEETVRGLPLARRGHLHRLSDGGARSPTGRIRPFPGQHHPASGPSHRHRSHRNHRRRGAGSSPPLGYWPDEAREHAHSPQSRGSPDQSALPAINRSRAPRPRPPPSLAGPSHQSPPLSKPRPRPPALRPAPPPPW